MKILSMKMMAIMAGVGYLGYMYFNKHPEIVKKIKGLGVKADNDTTNIVPDK